MNNKLKLILKITLPLVFVYIMLFAYMRHDLNSRIKELEHQQLENLKIHYNLTTKYFRDLADTVVAMIKNDKTAINLIQKLNPLPQNSKEAQKYRKMLYIHLLGLYHELVKKGVLQVHFLNSKTITTLRMHKPSQYGDDLSTFKYSMRIANETKKPVSGLEKGRTSPSYRNVRPIFAKDGTFLGIIDIAFAPEVIQENLSHYSKIHSHFILDKKLFKGKKWQRNDLKDDYKPSLENPDFLEFIYHSKSTGKNTSHPLIRQLIQNYQQTIIEKMNKRVTFSLYRDYDDTALIASFLPLKNIQGEVIAYLVSYIESQTLHLMLKDYYMAHFVVIVILLLVGFITFKTVQHQIQIAKEKAKYYTLSQYDTLTGLPNRTLFFDRLKMAKEKAKRYNKKFALLFIDLDNFKEINDINGHDEGDELLQQVAKQLKRVIREEDTLARLGGDEFTIILEEIKKTSDIDTVTSKILSLFKKPIELKHNKHFVSASIGISVYPDDTTELKDLLKFADTAMYKAKQAGKNRVAFYSKEMSDEIIERNALLAQMHKALENGDFIVYYQPQIDIETNKLYGLEALVRWNDPQGTIITPATFIPLAEESGFIIKLDKYVMQQAMQQIVSWYKEGFNPGNISLNLSMKQLEKKDFISVLENLLKETGCKAEWITLEVTEGHIMTNPDLAIETLQKIHAMGITISIDDFGTGYSSLSYLKKLPINKLKIDQSFVKELPNDQEDAKIVKIIIGLGKSLEMEIIAEGVEKEEQEEFLLQNGCHIIQGYLHSKPISAEEIKTKFLLSS